MQVVSAFQTVQGYSKALSATGVRAKHCIWLTAAGVSMAKTQEKPPEIRAHSLGATGSTGHGELSCAEASPQGNATFPW